MGGVRGIDWRALEVNSLRLVSVRQADGDLLFHKVAIAGSFWARCRGLLGQGALAPGEALFLVPCRSIHTCGMRFKLDLLFVDSSLVVLQIVTGLGPWRMAWGGTRAHGVLEYTSGWLDPQTIAVGERLILSAY